MADDEYRTNLAALQRIRSIAGGCALDLPQVCVVGDQSSGKSALLSEITGLHFPVNAGICTKAPIVVECKEEHLEDGLDVYEIMTPEGTYVRVEKPEQLAQEITDRQNSILRTAGVKISKDEIRVRVRGPKKVALAVFLPLRQ